IRTWVEGGIPLLGICLGTQVIFSSSEENDTACLGIVPGMVKRFPELVDPDGRPLKIPHMGWNSVHFTREHPVFRDIPAGAEFYFVHSYYPDPAPDPAPNLADDNWVIGQTQYGITFCSAVAHKNLVAVQFHPEKSGRPGLQILANFCRWGGRDVE
ncbi:MAG: imidazole glycerol phosphate synthase subunit HisH, partial [Deltaproteobacteria bacterium]|nr:imidazole glycerol phosphate synthase subunit HisH [Deltaproteobacteria bacterium]